MLQDPERPVTMFPYEKTRLTKIDYKAIIEKGEPWVDAYFRPELTSILDSTMPKTARHKPWEDLVWKRPKDVYGKDNFCVFKKITPTDIRQGLCGDCYYLSCIASLAEWPDRVKEIFITEEPNKAGCYAMQFYVNGEPEIIVVDDYFPYSESKRDWAFSRSSGDKEIWVQLLEKAWAKIFGNYHRIEAGTTGEALPVLTGAPSSFFYHSEVKNKEIIWDQIKKADDKDYIIATAVSSARQGKNAGEMSAVGLVDAHAYSLISTYEEVDGHNQRLRLIKIRNPWGFKEWTGDWSDKSDKWTKEMKEKLDFEAQDDGIFFISFQDYLNFFYITTISKYVQDNDVSSVADQHEPYKYCVSKFTLPTDYNNRVELLVSQIHARFIDETMNGQYRYAPLKLILAKVIKKTPEGPNQTATDELVFLDGQYLQFQHAHLDFPSLKQGEYFVIYKADWNARLHPQRKLVLSIYCADPVQITRVHASKFPQHMLYSMEEFLNQRMSMGSRYEAPLLSQSIEMYNHQERLSITQLEFSLPIESLNLNEPFTINSESTEIQVNESSRIKLKDSLAQLHSILLIIDKDNLNGMILHIIKIDSSLNIILELTQTKKIEIRNKDAPPMHVSVDQAIDRLLIDRGCEREQAVEQSQGIRRIKIEPYIPEHLQSCYLDEIE